MVKSKLLQTSAPRNSLFSCVYWQMMVIIKLRSKNLATFTAGLEQNPEESVDSGASFSCHHWLKLLYNLAAETLLQSSNKYNNGLKLME